MIIKITHLMRYAGWLRAPPNIASNIGDIKASIIVRDPLNIELIEVTFLLLTSSRNKSGNNDT